MVNPAAALPSTHTAPSASAYRPPEMKTEKLFSLKLGDVKSLTGQDTYNTWSAVMKRMLKAMGTYEITVEGIKPADNDTTETLRAFNQQDMLLQPRSFKLFRKIFWVRFPTLIPVMPCGYIYNNNT